MIAPHWRHMSLARISNVSPWQIGQRHVLMGPSIRAPAREPKPVPARRVSSPAHRDAVHHLQQSSAQHGQPQAVQVHRPLSQQPQQSQPHAPQAVPGPAAGETRAIRAQRMKPDMEMLLGKKVVE